jgi:hypothetical protein
MSGGCASGRPLNLLVGRGSLPRIPLSLSLPEQTHQRIWLCSRHLI